MKTVLLWMLILAAAGLGGYLLGAAVTEFKLWRMRRKYRRWLKAMEQAGDKTIINHSLYE